MKTHGILRQKAGYGNEKIPETQEIQFHKHEKTEVEYKDTDVGERESKVNDQSALSAMDNLCQAPTSYKRGSQRTNGIRSTPQGKLRAISVA